MSIRQREEIIRDILSTAMEQREGLGISKIMFHVGLTHGQARAYLTDLMEKGLIDYGITKNFYHTTSKGVEYLAAISGITEMLYSAPMETKL